MKTLLACAALLCTAATWVADVKTIDGAQIYVDTDSFVVLAKGQGLLSWEKTVYANGTINMARVARDCKDRTYKILESHLYEKGAKVPKDFYATDSTSWTSAIPDTIGDYQMTEICAALAHANDITT